MIDFNELKKEQIKLARKVIITNGFEKIKTIAGADQAYVNNKIISAIVVLIHPLQTVWRKKHEK